MRSRPPYRDRSRLLVLGVVVLGAYALLGSVALLRGGFGSPKASAGSPVATAVDGADTVDVPADLPSDLASDLATDPTDVPPVGSSPHFPESDVSHADHSFPDLEGRIPKTVAGRSTQYLDSFTGDVALEDEALFGGAFGAIIDEYIASDAGSPDLEQLQVAVGYVPVASGEWVEIRAYRVPGRRANDWAPIEDRLVAGQVDYQSWSFVAANVGGKAVLVGASVMPNDPASAWIYVSGDTMFELAGRNEGVATAVLAELR